MTVSFGPPLDLTDLAQFQAPHAGDRRSVFLGRVSTKDLQSPASSLPRQAVAAAARLEPGEQFVAHFWDCESGMLAPELRGLGSQEMYAALEVPLPRDGGLQDLLECAEQQRITHVLAERTDRVARAMLTSLTVEHELAKVGVEVVYANEAVGGTPSGQLRTRRYSQVDAEIYRATLIEMSMGGQIQHAVQGWNHGHPPYPYTTEIDDTAPIPAAGRFGRARPKRKLVPHPDIRRFAAARELCRLRREEHLTNAEIIAVLSAEPDLYPGRWTHNLVAGLIANPKLTGYQVYNRRATRTGRPGTSRRNPMSQWVWSPEPVHEPVISVSEWKQAQVITAAIHGAGAAEGDALLRIRAAAAGLTVAVVSRSDSHARYRIEERTVVLPIPIPDSVVRQAIADIGAAR